MVRTRRKSLSRISDVFDFLAQLDSPVTFLGPTPYGCLGLETYVNPLTLVSALDCVGSLSRSVQTPADDRIATYETAVQTCNEMLRHKEMQTFLMARGEGFLWTQSANDETFALSSQYRQTLLSADAKLISALSNDDGARALFGKAGVALIPQVTGQVETYADLLAIGQKAKLGERLVVQTGAGHGRRTLFIDRERNWSDFADVVAGVPLTISKFVGHTRCRAEIVVTPQGTVVGPIFEMVRMVGAEGALASAEGSADFRGGIQLAAKKIGSALLAAGFVGLCDCVFYCGADDKTYLKRIRPGFSPFSQLTQVLTAHYGGLPLAAFHLLAHLGVEHSVDLAAIQKRWHEHGTWSALVLSHSETSTEFITKSPASTIYSEATDGMFDIAMPSADPRDLRGENECLYLCMLGTGTYRQPGLQLGLVMGRGDAFKAGQTGDSRAVRWARAFSGMYNAVQMSGSSLPKRDINADAGLF
jgi:hypothetical protein